MKPSFWQIYSNWYDRSNTTLGKHESDIDVEVIIPSDDYIPTIVAIKDDEFNGLEILMYDNSGNAWPKTPSNTPTDITTTPTPTANIYDELALLFYTHHPNDDAEYSAAAQPPPHPMYHPSPPPMPPTPPPFGATSFGTSTPIQSDPIQSNPSCHINNESISMLLQGGIPLSFLLMGKFMPKGR